MRATTFLLRRKKKTECQRIDAFELWCWRRLLRVPWTARRSKQSIWGEINPEYSLEGQMLKLHYFGYLMWRVTHWKSPWCWERSRAGEEDVRGWDGWMASQNPGDGEGQGGLACCSPWGCKESDTTARLNNNTDILCVFTHTGPLCVYPRPPVSSFLVRLPTSQMPGSVVSNSQRTGCTLGDPLARGDGTGAVAAGGMGQSPHHSRLHTLCMSLASTPALPILEYNCFHFTSC